MKFKKEGILYECISFVFTLIISFLAVFLFTTFIAKPVRVEGSSMYPTLKDQDIAFSSLMNLEKIERFDIVVIRVNEKYVVKRVVGLPNETISVFDDTLYIDGVAVEEDFFDEAYVSSQEIKGIFTYDINEITLGEDEYYVLGDNRMNSQDSRAYGPFHKEQIISKHFFVLYPLDRIGVK